MLENEKDEIADNEAEDRGYAQRKYDDYIARRNFLADAAYRQADSFDRNVLWLASGSIGLSVILLGQLSADSAIRATWSLYLSWGSLVLCLITTLWSFLTSLEAHELEIKIADATYGTSGTVSLEAYETAKVKLLDRLNWVSFFSFVIGVGLLCLFASLNIGSFSTDKGGHSGYQSVEEDSKEDRPWAQACITSKAQTSAKEEVESAAGRYQMLHPADGAGIFILDSKTGELAVLVEDADSVIVRQAQEPLGNPN